METLEPTETPPEAPSRNPPGPQTLESTDAPLVESRVSSLGLGLNSAASSGGGASEPGLVLPAKETVGDNHFAVGDFVWGKIKNHPWWPGQVYDPSQASDHARSAHRKEHCLLVAYFGDDSFAWCEPAQLKPFAPEFSQMAKQNGARNFVSAVGDAVVAIRRRLESELTCCCTPAETRAGLELRTNVESFANYAPGEFLERLQDVACDVSAADMLEVVMISSWVLAFGKGSFSSGSFTYHPRREIADLVDKIDLDAPPPDSVGDEMGQEEPWITGTVNKPEMSDEKLSHSRKKRSMAKLIAEMDLDAVDLSDDEEEKAEAVTPNKPSASKRKKDGSEKVLGSVDVSNGDIKMEEESSSGLGRRERKKSKYLSPPYTFLSSYTKLLVTPKATELKTPKKASEASQSWLSEPAAILKCNSGVLQDEEEEEEDMKSPVTKIDNMPAIEILSEFLSTALNPHHLKWSRTTKTIRGFFAVYRSSVYSDGSGFDAYQKHLGDCVGMGGKSASKDRVDRPEGGRSHGKKRRWKGGVNEETLSNFGQETTDHSEQLKGGPKKKMRKEGADEVSPFDLGQSATDHSEHGKAGRMRKMKKDGASKETLLGSVLDASEPGKTGPKGKTRKNAGYVEPLVDLNIQIPNGSEENRSPDKQMGKDGANGERMMNMGQEPISTPKSGKLRRKNIKGKDISNQKTPTELEPVLVGYVEGDKLGQKKGTDGPGRETLADSGCKITNGMEAAKSGQKRKKKDATTNLGPAALILTFAPGITLPSKEHLISTFRKYGDLIDAETELLKESGCARVVFAKSTDAEKALRSRDKSGAFESPVPSYRLCHLPGNLSSPPTDIPIPKPPLPYIRKNLERMISTLSGSSSPEKDAGSSDWLKPEAKENLVGEMRGLLQKVNKMLNGPAAGVSS